MASTSYHDWLHTHQQEIQHIVARVQLEGGFLSEAVEKLLRRFKRYLGPEPLREGKLASITNSAWFIVLNIVVILCDSAFTAVVTDYSMDAINRNPTTFMYVVEVAFVLFYVVECSMRIVVHGKYFFVSNEMSWNLFDLVLTLQGVADIVLTHGVTVDHGHVQFMRLVRLVKLGKILRLFRAVSWLRDLRVMAQSITHCVGAMFWAFVMLALILYIAALFFVQMMRGHLQERDGTIDDETVSMIYNYFGSIGQGVLTLYQSASGGLDWENVYAIVSRSGPFTSTGFIFFIWFFNFAVINILSGIFIEKALYAAVPDREQLSLEHRREEERDVAHLTELISSMDTKKTGKISLQNFLLQAHDPYASAYLRTLGIRIEDASMFFHLLQRVLGSEELPIEDFVGRLVRMKGTAKSLDLQSVAFEVSLMRRTINEIASHTRANRGTLESFASTGSFSKLS